MTAERGVPNLHDAVLRTIVLEWNPPSLRIALERDRGEVVLLTASGVREFSLTHREEWGPSDCVNRADVQEEQGLARLKVEMQSGDLITVVAERLETT